MTSRSICLFATSSPGLFPEKMGGADPGDEVAFFDTTYGHHGIPPSSTVYQGKGFDMIELCDPVGKSVIYVFKLALPFIKIFRTDATFCTLWLYHFKINHRRHKMLDFVHIVKPSSCSLILFLFFAFLRLRVSLRRVVMVELVYRTTNITRLTAFAKTIMSETYATYLVSFL